MKKKVNAKMIRTNITDLTISNSISIKIFLKRERRL